MVHHGRAQGRAVRRGVVVVLALALGAVALATAPPSSYESAGQLLHRLASLTEAQVDAMITRDRSAVLELLNAQPEAAAREWPRLPEEQRLQLESRFPSLVGNLDGVSYLTRDRANRRELAAQLRASQAAAFAHPTDQGAAIRAASYKAISAALHTKTRPARSLVELVPGVRPTAAISVGNVQTAPMVTWTVPGMGTYTTDMQLWTLAAQNVWDAQAAAGAPTGHAVIAWMGYAVPPVGIDAALGEYATRGAPLLVEAIQGVSAYRHADPPVLNVVAHSYGTTLAADALAGRAVGVSAFVMLGSAGVEERIASASDLHAQRVYAGEAADDEEAFLGRLSRIDPRVRSFGATVIPVDGDPRSGLASVTGHAPILHSAYNDDIASKVWTAIPSLSDRVRAYRQHLAEHGYLDSGTQSLQQVGKVTATVDRPVRTPSSVHPSTPFGPVIVGMAVSLWWQSPTQPFGQRQ